MSQLRRSLTLLVLLVSAWFAIAPAVAFAQATPTTGQPTEWIYEIPGDMVFPEGVAFDPVSRDLYVGSTNDGTIYGENADSGPGVELSVILPGGEDGRTSAIGMKLDAGRLVIAGGSTGMVFVYDVDSHRLIGRYSNGLSGESTFLNDLAIAPDGAAYVTDSFNPVLYRVPATGSGVASPVAAPIGSPEAIQTLEPWLPLDGTAIPYQDEFNLNGIVVSNDGSALLVVHGSTGQLFRIDIATQEIVEVNLGGEALTGGDGMVLDGSLLYVVRTENMITVVDLSDDLRSGTVLGSFTDPSFSTPTTAAKTDGCLLVVNSQFENIGGTLELPFTVSFVPIPEEFLSAPPVGATCG